MLLKLLVKLNGWEYLIWVAEEQAPSPKRIREPAVKVAATHPLDEQPFVGEAFGA